MAFLCTFLSSPLTFPGGLMYIYPPSTSSPKGSSYLFPGDCTLSQSQYRAMKAITSAAVAVVAAVMVAPAVAFMSSSISTTKVVPDSYSGSGRVFSSRAKTRPVRSPHAAERVDAEVVSDKSATAAKTEEIIDAAKEVYSSIAAAVKDFDSSKLQDDAVALGEGIKTNTQAGVSGERGEGWTAAQIGILLFVIFGNLPILGGSLEIVAGPGLLLAGAGLAGASALQLGKTFSPWPEPAEGGVLNTTGVYSLCRHPMYAGLVMFSLGLGFTTSSFTRIALACLLGYVLDREANLEEEKLMTIHPAYKTYKEEVSKFLPTVY